MNIKLFSIIFGISIILLIGKSFSNPIGKSLSCNSVLKENLNYKSFKGISFETEKSVRVVTLKMKNNQLALIKTAQTKNKIIFLRELSASPISNIRF